MIKPETSLLLTERIKAFMRRLKITEAELARQIDVPQATVSRILSGATKDPRISTLVAIAHTLGTTVDHLVDDGVTTYTVPVLEWQDIPAFLEHGIDELKHSEWISVSHPPARGSFALKTTPSMEPRYRRGSTIIIEPTETYRDFQVAIVSFSGTEPTIRRLVKDGANISLKPLDATPNSPPTPLTPNEIIIGVVTEARMTER